MSPRHYVEALSELTGRKVVSVEDGKDIRSVLNALIDLYDAWGEQEMADKYRVLLREADVAGGA